MKFSPKAQEVYSQIDPNTTKLGDIRKIAKEVKKDHDLAMELWLIGEYLPRQLAILIMDKKLLTSEVIDQLCEDIQTHKLKDRTQLIDWLMANQLAKDKRTIALMESWKDRSNKLQRRLFWYYQARLRWMGNTDHSNTEELLALIEKNLLKEEPEVQWAMNFTAGQVGKWQEEHRERCISIGETTGLYADEVAPKNCTPNYLPKFIVMEVAKLKKKK